MVSGADWKVQANFAPIKGEGLVLVVDRNSE